MTLKRILPYLALSLCPPLHAASLPSGDRLDTLAEAPYWLALGHYERGKLGGWRSYVDDTDFFLAAEGNSDPAAVLFCALMITMFYLTANNQLFGSYDGYFVAACMEMSTP